MSLQLQALLRNIRQYPLKTKQQIIEIYIAYLLRSKNLGELRLFCQNLLKKEELMPGYVNCVTFEAALNDEISNIVNLNLSIGKKLDTVMSILDSTTTSVKDEDVSTKLENLNAMLDELRLSLIGILGGRSQECQISVAVLLGQIEQEKIHRDEAMQDAMQTLFDRIFAAIDPDALENYLEQSHLLIGPLKKSALHEASKEKYHQLQAYHQSGHFVRDFKVAYKRNLRKNSRADK